MLLGPSPLSSEERQVANRQWLLDRLMTYLRDTQSRSFVKQTLSDDLRLDLTTPVYISMDLDGLDPAFAPGVSHREPGGLTTRQVINLIQSVNQPIVAADGQTSPLSPR